MERISRYILVLVSAIAAAVVLPWLYRMTFDKPVHVPFVVYSCVNNDFMIQETENGKQERTDTHGNKYTREEYEQKLPLMYTRQLLTAGTMPDTINGTAIDMHELLKAKSVFYYKPEMMNTPHPELYPLFESESGRANLEMPDDFFRITWRMEFINAETNKIEEEKSRLFSVALYKKGFTFPSKLVAGIPTNRKSCDEGYFITDSADQLFHLKMMDGNPYVKKVDLPEGLKFRFINCVDFKDKKYYAYLFSEDNGIYILTQDEYELIKLPIEGFNPGNCDLRILGDIFYYNVIIRADDHLQVDVLNYSDYKKVDTYRKNWLTRSELPAGKIAAAIFPVQISMTDKNSNFINFYIEKPSGFAWIIVNLILAGIHLFVLLKRKTKISRHFFDLTVVTFTGFFGYIAVNLFQNKLFD